MSKVKVVAKSNTGRNAYFQDVESNKIMTRAGFVKEIRKGNYPGYGIRKIYGKYTPVSKKNNGIENCLKNNYCN